MGCTAWRASTLEREGKLFSGVSTCKVEGAQIRGLDWPDVPVVVDQAGHGIVVKRAGCACEAARGKHCAGEDAMNALKIIGGCSTCRIRPLYQLVLNSTGK